MKNKKLTITLIVLLCIFIGISSMACVFFYNAKTALNTISEQIAQSSNVTEGEVPETDFTKFYETLVLQMEQYGNKEEMEDKLASLVSMVYVKTLKDCTVKSISFNEDEIDITIHGVAVPFDQINTSLITAAAVKAAFQYLGSNFSEALTYSFQGSDGLMEMLYGKYGSQFMETLKDEIKDLPVETVEYTFSITMEDGKWIFQTGQSNS